MTFARSRIRRSFWVVLHSGSRGVGNQLANIHIDGAKDLMARYVSGKGNPASFCSCSHGAGRRMSRGRARRELDREGLTMAMASKAWNGNADKLIDEDPRAYKDIDEVMAAQADLVNVEHALHQILNYKGT